MGKCQQGSKHNATWVNRQSSSSMKKWPKGNVLKYCIYTVHIQFFSFDSLTCKLVVLLACQMRWQCCISVFVNLITIRAQARGCWFYMFCLSKSSPVDLCLFQIVMRVSKAICLHRATSQYPQWCKTGHFGGKKLNTGLNGGTNERLLFKFE